ncbi:MAG: N-acetylneuraminate synthase [candidate division Zixibacteria bacterium]|nr:N-acetylneuraminate synthase [candidate division Zixibacteria bacterium]
MQNLTLEKPQSRFESITKHHKSFNFGSKKIGNGNPVFIIAECGINHGGSYKVAEEMIQSAVKCGADAVKFQSYITEKRVPSDNLYFDLFKKCELSEDDQRDLNAKAHSLGIEFFSTPFDPESVAILEEIGVPGYKVASFDIVNKALIRSVCHTGKPVICSTGMADESEINSVMEIFDNAEIPFALLHCISAYPTELNDANLNVINTLKSICTGPVGYSDHTLGIKAPVLAVAAGAKVIEKHFTLDKNADGPDHQLSADPDDMKKMIEQIREVETIFGSSVLKVTPAETTTLIFRRPSK